MNDKFVHFFPMIPPKTTAQMHKIVVRNGKPYIYDPEPVVKAKEKLMAHLGQRAPAKPFEGALSLSVIWNFPVIKGHQASEPYLKKPDTDNLQKMLKDVMTKLRYWNDDAQVCCEMIVKKYAAIPGIFVQIDLLT